MTNAIADIGRDKEASIWWLHVPCNDRNGMMRWPCEVDALTVYVGRVHVLDVAGMPLGFRIAHENGKRRVKFYGVGYFDYGRAWPHVGNIHWNAYSMRPQDVCRLLTRLRDAYGWTAEHGLSLPFDAMHAGARDNTLPPPVTPEMFDTEPVGGQ